MFKIKYISVYKSYRCCALALFKREEGRSGVLSTINSQVEPNGVTGTLGIGYILPFDGLGMYSGYSSHISFYDCNPKCLEIFYLEKLSRK